MLQAQLDSQSSHLGELCQRLVHAYDNQNVDDSVRDDLFTLADVLQQASNVATRLHDESLAQLCMTLSTNVVGMADHFDEPGPSELDLLKKITAAFQMAMSSGQRGATAPGADAAPPMAAS